mmetsp:Transcript_7963/g.20210  ORF Transcript_7963/g.20210 Transcript_7963/m.20210 type:complete len:201 (-) Transcript_7963:869-1471(-)
MSAAAAAGAGTAAGPGATRVRPSDRASCSRKVAQFANQSSQEILALALDQACAATRSCFALWTRVMTSLASVQTWPILSARPLIPEAASTAAMPCFAPSALVLICWQFASASSKLTVFAAKALALKASTSSRISLGWRPAASSTKACATKSSTDLPRPAAGSSVASDPLPTCEPLSSSSFNSASGRTRARALLLAVPRLR